MTMTGGLNEVSESFEKGIKLIESRLLREKIYEFTHGSGLRVQLIPKPGYQKKFAVAAVNFGASCTRFITAAGDSISVPEGTAHFLEHKLFEQPDFNVSERLAALGADSNAGTSFGRTVYYFKTTENFEECFRILLGFVTNPYITDESVEKEKGIICREIKMYEDSPEYAASMNLFRAMYHNNPVRNEIAGTVESVKATDRETLELCYRNFYCPSNMVVTVSGDVDIAAVKRITEECIPDGFNARPATPVYEEEPESVASERVDCFMDVSSPVFCVGFKDNHAPSSNGYELLKRGIAGTVLKVILFGRSSAFFENLYDRGLITQEFYADYEAEREYAAACVGGESEKPLEVLEEIKKLIERVKHDSISETDFERVKRSLLGGMIQRFNSPEAAGRFFSNIALLGVFGFDYFEACVKITIDDVKKVFDEVYTVTPVISIVWPEKNKTDL